MNESLHTLFLAQLIGLVLLITAIIMLSRADYYRGLIMRMQVGSSSIAVGASLGLMIGVGLVLLHNIWIFESEVLVTLVAWAVLIKSILWLSIPERMVEMARQVYSGPGYYVIAAVTGIIGIILVIHGFYLFTGNHPMIVTP